MQDDKLYSPKLPTKQSSSSIYLNSMNMAAQKRTYSLNIRYTSAAGHRNHSRR